MAVLPDADRAAVTARSMSDTSASREQWGTTLLKSDRRGLVDAIDQWIEDSLSSFNAALPEPARTELTTKQKYKEFVNVLDRKREVL